MPIQLTEREDQALEVILEDGGDRTYYPGWQLSIDVHNIQEASEICKEDEGVQIKRYLTGTAVLQDRDISIIGEPEKKTRTLDLGIFDREIEMKPDSDEVPSLFNPVGFANVGFNRADWEFGTKDQWHVSLYLPKAAFEPLFATVAEGRITQMSLVLRLKVYTTHHPMAPGARDENLFLRPSDPGVSFGWPKTADGYVVAINTRKTLHAIAPPPDSDPYAGEDEPNTEMQLPARAPVDPVATSITALIVNVEKLRVTLKWGVGIIAVVLLFLVGK